MSSWAHFLARWSMWIVSVPYFRVRCVGRQHVPKTGGVLLVANHMSHLDPPIVGAFAPRRLRFLARSTLGNRPWARRLLKALGSIFVVRGKPTRESMQSAIDALRDDQALLMFPEGSRSDDGLVHPFLRGFELIARRGDAVILPVGIRGTLQAFPRGAGFPRPRRVELHFGEPITNLKAFGGSDALRARVAELAGTGLAEIGLAEAGLSETGLSETGPTSTERDPS